MFQRPFAIEWSNSTRRTQSTEIDERLASLRMEEENLREEANRLREEGEN